MTDRNAEWQRLKELYTAYSDEEVVGLSSVSDGLTDDAQSLLVREIARRRLVINVADEAPESEPAIDQPVAEGDVQLLMFQDMFSASKALDLLDEASIPFRLRTERTPNDSMRAGVDLMFVDVKGVYETAAQELLRREMGLFPLQEIPDQPEEADEAMLPLAEVETRAEADEVLRILRVAGIDGRIAPPARDAEEGDWIEVEVRARVYPQALQVMEEGFVSEQRKEQ